MQDRERLLDLPGAHHEPRSDVASFLDGDLELPTLIAIVGMFSPQVGIHPRRARGDADDPQVSRRLMGEDPGTVDTIGERAGIDEERDQVVKLLLEGAKVRAESAHPRRREIALDAAQGYRTPQQPRPEQLVLQSAETLGTRLG